MRFLTLMCLLACVGCTARSQSQITSNIMVERCKDLGGAPRWHTRENVTHLFTCQMALPSAWITGAK